MQVDSDELEAVLPLTHDGLEAVENIPSEVSLPSWSHLSAFVLPLPPNDLVHVVYRSPSLTPAISNFSMSLQPVPSLPLLRSGPKHTVELQPDSFSSGRAEPSYPYSQAHLQLQPFSYDFNCGN